MDLNSLLERALKQRTQANEQMLEGLYGDTALSDWEKQKLRDTVRELHVIVRWLRGQINEN